MILRSLSLFIFFSHSAVLLQPASGLIPFFSSRGASHSRTQPVARTLLQASSSPDDHSWLHHRSKRRPTTNKPWLEQATERLLQPSNTTSPAAVAHLGQHGKWHEVLSLLAAWSAEAKRDPRAPAMMEALLKRLLDEKRAGASHIVLDVDIYNRVLDAWACAALFRQQNVKLASQRAREILVLMQETYEAGSGPQPNRESFRVVLHVVTKIEGPLIARRLLGLMEYLVKSGKNPLAKPTRSDYIMLLDAYASSNDDTAGALADGFLRHMRTMGQEPDTLCYNIAIKAWSRSRNRQSAEHADRILEEMTSERDLVTYASVISAWAISGMRSHAVARAEELLEELQSKGLEPNTVVLNAVMSAGQVSQPRGGRSYPTTTLADGAVVECTTRLDFVQYPLARPVNACW